MNVKETYRRYAESLLFAQGTGSGERLKDGACSATVIENIKRLSEIEAGNTAE